MRFSKASFVLAAVVILTAFIPTAAYAELLTNSYGQTFAGQAACVECHGGNYAQTTHSEFAKPGVGQEGEAPLDIYPAGRIDIGLSVPASEVAFTLGAGTGLREYISINGTSSPFAMLEGMEWNPVMPETWEMPAEGIAVAAYQCSQCHQLGVVRQDQKPKAGTFASAPTSTVDAWATMASDPDNYVPGASIQCERCHGTGLTSAAPGGTGHWNSGVKIVGFNTLTMKSSGRAASQRVLKSEVCGQCHGSFKTGSSIIGYTPDQRLNDFVVQYKESDVPTSTEAFLANKKGYKFYPNGENYSLKHSYYTEWAMSGHAHRGGITSTSPEAMPFQQADHGHFNAKTSDIKCSRCHTGEGYLKRKGAPIAQAYVESTATAGQIGQECGVCHVSHEIEGGGLQIREPEAGNASMCEDCHNWQNEVMGTTLVPTTTGRGPSHPQRENVHGRNVMFDVPNMGEFMPGATCEECHMPATKADFPNVGLERYADRSYKRYSHRMFIMEPGNAKAWGLAAWGDSCSPCHPGETQDELQANLEEWQADALAESDAALAAITAAKLDAEFANAAGKELAGRAFVNQKAYANDASGGAHNPPYIIAGLKAATKMAKSVGGTINIYASSSVTYGNMAYVAGNLDNGDGSAAGGAKVALLKNGVEVDSSVSDANGNVSFMVPTNVIGSASYVLRWDRCDSNTADKLSAAKTVVVKKIVSKTTARLSASTVYLRRYVSLSGSVAPAAAGQKVTVEVKRGSGAWGRVETRTLSGSSTFYARYQTLARGTYYWRVKYAGTATVAPSTSASLRMVVR